MKPPLPFAVGLALLLTVPAPLRGQSIDLRLSIKVIVHPTSGTRPSNITPEMFTNALAAANQWMGAYQRGYRFAMTELVSIGGPFEGGTNGPSKYFDRVFRDGSAWTAFYADAQADSRYRLRSDQVNIWVATPKASPGNSGGAMPIPPSELAPGGQIFADDGGWWVVHELGHFFGLPHTFEGENANSCSPGNDGLADTLADSTCWTSVNLAAQYHFGMNYSALSTTDRTRVDDVYFNVMSYHEATSKNTVESRLTELQLDRVTNHANGDRHAYVGGYTRAVSLSGDNANSGLNVGAPKRTVLNAVYASNPSGGDIVLVRPGSYNEQITLSQPVTLRATRAGLVTIGRP